MTDSNKYEFLLKRIGEVKKEGNRLRTELTENPSHHKVVEAKLEKIEAELVECTQQFLELAGLEEAFKKYQQKE